MDIDIVLHLSHRTHQPRNQVGIEAARLGDVFDMQAPLTPAIIIGGYRVINSERESPCAGMKVAAEWSAGLQCALELGSEIARDGNPSILFPVLYRSKRYLNDRPDAPCIFGG
ncbi:hypothetical protein DAH66_09765 [Sphingomonas koreensis]|uniref:Uncharacterized protein n=1 Tax=Sphingomonas koreensis TaxID=93064 RepID=A0A430G4C2_9SPHN|nr:hypothetical protein DAH66_09765 [Sphingomonas koreensis]